MRKVFGAYESHVLKNSFRLRPQMATIATRVLKAKLKSTNERATYVEINSCLDAHEGEVATWVDMQGLDDLKPYTESVDTVVLSEDQSPATLEKIRSTFGERVLILNCEKALGFEFKTVIFMETFENPAYEADKNSLSFARASAALFVLLNTSRI